MGYELSDEMKATDVVKALYMTVKIREYPINQYIALNWPLM